MDVDDHAYPCSTLQAPTCSRQLNAARVPVVDIGLSCTQLRIPTLFADANSQLSNQANKGLVP